MLRFLNIKAFIFSFIVGLIFIYFVPHDNSLIYVYPTPDNIKKVEYKDKTSSCYEYVEQLINCPSDKNKIKNIPVQK